MDGVGSHPLGIELTEKFCEASCRVEAGSTVVFYTDGITERRRRDRALFGVERMDQAVGGHDDRSVSAVLNRILHAAESFADGVPGHDDQTLVVASIS
jgi:sigma-B regulation protein RsbU (phosphoserine phosphatase)